MSKSDLSNPRSGRSAGETGEATASNARLLDRCAQGDPMAWELLIERYERLVAAIAVREGVRTSDVSDVVQSTFSVLLERLASIREPDRLAFWLSTVARRQAWQWIRDQAREELTLDGHLERADETRGDLDDTVWLHDAVERLDEPCRTVIASMFLTNGPRTYAELAAAINRPVGSIGPVRARCLDSLREQLSIDHR